MEREKELVRNTKVEDRIRFVGRGEVAAISAGAVSWPLLLATYIPQIEQVLKPVEGPIELAALASLVLFWGARANRLAKGKI